MRENKRITFDEEVIHADIYIPEAMIYCTRFAGRDGRNIIQTEEIKGNLDNQIEHSFF